MAFSDDFTGDFERPGTTRPIQPPSSSASGSSDFRAILRFIQRRLVLIAAITLGVALVAGVFAFVAQPRYIGHSIIMLGINKKNVAETDPSLSTDTPVTPEIVRSELDVIRSRAVVDMVIDKLGLMKDPEFAPKAKGDEKTLANATEETILKRLKVDNDGRSFGIHIYFTSKDPNKAALITNTFAEQYLAHQQAVKTKLTEDAAAWLESRMNGLKDRVTQSEQAAAQFRANNNLITVGQGAADDRQTLASQQLGALTAELVTAKANTYQAEARLRAAQGAGAGASEIQNSPLIQSLRGQEATLNATEADLLSRYGPLHPKVIAVRAQRDEIEEKISAETQRILRGIQADAQAARQAQGAIQGNINALTGQVTQEASNKVQLDELDRQSQANEQLYETFLQRAQAVAEQATLQVPDASIIAVAKPPHDPSFPNKKLLILAGLVLGAMIGVFVAFMIEFLDPSFRSLEQVERSTGQHVAGLIPDVRGMTNLPPETYVVERPGSQFAEALRSLWTDLGSRHNGVIRSLAVTSTTQGEGKTTLALSLARVLAQGGRRVLLIDGDMRRSRVAPILGLKARNGGFAALLAGKQRFADVVQNDVLVKSLSVVLSDGGAIGVQDLLSQEALSALLSEVQSHCDLVIIDTPPVGAVTDAAALSRASDVTVYLTEWAKTPEAEVNRAIRQFLNIGGTINGIALSRIKIAEYRKYVDGYNPDVYSAYFAN